MKKYIIQTIIFIFIFSSFVWQANTIQSQTLVIDNFNKKPINVGKKYPNYVNTKDGYDIYYTEANLQLSRIPISASDTSDKILRLDFNIPPAFSWGNWLSVRRELQSPLDLDNYKGLKLNLRVEVPSSDTFLRITLSDITDNKNEGDEMWWFDCNRNLLKNKTQNWIQILIPFDDFRASYGDGTRLNDYKLNLKKIVAYEINLISESRNTQKGIILVDYLCAYR